MTTRILPREEWSRLAPATQLPVLLERTPNSEVYVVEENGEIVACVATMAVTHLEGLWVAPRYRGNPGVFRRLVRRLGDVLKGSRWAWATAQSDCMRGILERLGGVPLPLDSYVLRREG